MIKFVTEFIGNCWLILIVVGSGIMGQTLSLDNTAIALLANSVATGFGLYFLITIFADISGAHFNPIVTLFELLQSRIDKRYFFVYLTAQFLGALSGVWLTHLMFGQSVLQISNHDRSEFRYYFSEVIATSGLIIVIHLSSQKKTFVVPACVATYIASAYWFTSSTSFANPAVTLARAFTNTFSGIRPHGVLGFIAAQVVGCVLGFFVVRFFDRQKLNS